MKSDSDKVTNSAEPSDEELAKLAQRGNIESGNQLFIRHGAELERLARSLLNWRVSDEDIKERLQEAYRVAWQRFGEFRSPYHFVPWIKGILINVSRNADRVDRNRDRIIEPVGGDEDIDKRGANVDDSPQDRMDLDRLLKALDQESERLDESHQKIARFMLDYFAKNDKWPSKREMAEGTGIPASSALRSQKRVLGSWEPLCRSRGFWPLV